MADIKTAVPKRQKQTVGQKLGIGRIGFRKAQAQIDVGKGIQLAAAVSSKGEHQGVPAFGQMQSASLPDPIVHQAGKPGRRVARVDTAGAVKIPGQTQGFDAHCKAASRSYNADPPASPVRMRMALSMVETNILPFADFSGLGGLLDHFQGLVEHIVVDDDLDLDLGHEIDLVLGATIDFLVTPAGGRSRVRP